MDSTNPYSQASGMSMRREGFLRCHCIGGYQDHSNKVKESAVHGLTWGAVVYLDAWRKSM